MFKSGNNSGMFVVTAGHGNLSGMPRKYSSLLQATGGYYGFF